MKNKNNELVPSKSGIYKITNSKSNKFYIGSSVNLSKRFSLHKLHLKNNRHHNIMLQRVFNNYEENCLLFEIIEFCEKDKVLEREQYYLDLLKPEYNICKIAGNCLGVKHTQETKELMSLKGKGKKKPKSYSEKLSKRLKGVPKSKEHIEKNRLAQLGKKKSEESKEKQRRTMTGREYIMTEKRAENLKRLVTLEKRLQNLPKGENNKFSKLTEEDVLKIRKLHDDKISNKEIRTLFPNVIAKTIRNIINRVTWKHI